MRSWKRLLTITTIASVALLGAACEDDEGVEEVDQTEVENTEVEGGTTTETETEVMTETEPAGTETSTEG